ncbi:TPA: long-chain fatty acid--CoA ligase [Salmonella enterica]|uniref:Long-chain fatty acid--CoA ligase n=1 Tax=Salmonella enterica TaxID=28901 RepID=A0A759YMX2_SALER|nr:long-chain fatty acid--CoA ligase [Salmonella enterica]
MNESLRSIRHKFEFFGVKDALIISDQCYTFNDLMTEIDEWEHIIHLSDIPSGNVVSIEGENSVSVISLIFALATNGNIIVPIKTDNLSQSNSFKELAQVDYSINLNNNKGFIKSPYKSSHNYYRQINHDKHAGIVLFSSGTTGKPKAIVLSLNKMLEKVNKKENNNRILSFLNYDHIGGINTILHGLCNGGCVIFPTDRKPETILKTIEKWQVQILPTTPTFINMLLMADDFLKYDLSSIRLITYGTESMPSSTLMKAATYFPNVIFKQTYGLSEVGILPTKSKSNNELWLKLGGNGFNYKIIDNILWIKSDIAMLGYLNASEPFDEQGYFNTQDVVEQDGEYIRILGRKSDIINIAGEKVYPAEVEGILNQVPGVLDVIVMAKPNPVTGMGINALIRYGKNVDPDILRSIIIRHAKDNLERFKQPLLYKFTQEELHSSRFKKRRTFS